MAYSILGGNTVPNRPKPATTAPAKAAPLPPKPIEIAAPAWLQPILDRLADADEKQDSEVEKYDDAEIKAAIEKLRQEVGPIAQMKAELARQKERADQLQKTVDNLMAQLVQARAQPKPSTPVQATPQWDTIRVIRGADGLIRDLKMMKE